MTQISCEYMHWIGLPLIRKELVKTMITNYGLNQKQSAEKLGISPAAVSQYLSRKRGKLNLTDMVISKEFKSSAERIIHHGETRVAPEICRLCCIVRAKGLLAFSPL